MGNAAVQAGAWGRLRGTLATLALVLVAWGLPQAALAECDLVATSASFQEGNPGDALTFSFAVQDPGPLVDAGPCAGASGSIAISNDGSQGATLSTGTWSVPTGGGPVSFQLTLGPQHGGFVDVQVTCSDCGDPFLVNTTLGFTGHVLDDYDVQLVQPASGLLQAQPGDTVTLTAILTANGDPAIERTVCWEIVSNPAGDAFFTNGQTFCGQAPAAGGAATKGTIAGPLVGTFVFNADGSTSVDLAVGQAALQPVEILVYPQDDMATVASIKVGTVPVLQAVTSSPISVDTGQAFPVQVSTLGIDGSPSSGNLISFTSTASPEISPASQALTTDASGNAVASFTANAEGSYPGAISAVLDPTPASPTSGDEQQLSFDVEVADVVSLTKPTSGSGDNQVATVNEPFAQPLAALVTRNGAPSSGDAVGWEVVSGPASVSSATTNTDGSGLARVTVTAGADPGTIQLRAFLVADPTQQAFYTLTAQSVRTLRMPSTGSGNLQSGTPGAEVSPLVAEALDDGVPAGDVAVNWSVLSGSALLSASQTVTGPDGRTQVGVTLGQQTGPVRIQAARADEPMATVVYQLNVVNVEQLTIVSGDEQDAQAGSDGEPLVVRFSRNGAPTGGQSVQWEVLSGDASVTPASSSTDGQGLASTAIAFGPAGGNVVVRASAGNAAPVQFAFTVAGGSGPPPEGLSLARVSGDGQRGAPGSRAEETLVVVASNAEGEPLAGVPVGWRILSGSAELDALEVRTDDEGRATVGFRFAQQAGPVVIRASAFSDLAFVDFTAEAFAPVITIVSGDGQQGQPGQALEQDFVVAIAEPAAAKSLEGTQVTWTVLEGDATLAAPATSTDAQGQSRNRLTLGSSTGTYRVRAEVPGGGQVEFTAVAAGNGALEGVSGDGQTLPTETLSEPLVVELRDAAGQPIPGATLHWSGDNAALENETTTTDDQGRSSNRARVLLPGTATITVTPEDVDAEPVVFSINAGVINTEGLAPNEREVADAVDQLCPALANLETRTAEQDDLLARCLELVDRSGDDPDDVADALEEMLQDVALTQVNAALLTASAQFDNLKARIAALRSGARGFSVAGLNVAGAGGVLPLSLLQAEDAGGEVGADFGRWGFFASGTIGRGEVDAGQATPEYEFDTAGLTAGVDYRASDRWIVGAAFGFSRQDTEVANERGKVDTDGWSLSAYTTWFNENSWYVDGVLTWGSNDYALERRIQYSITAADGSITSVDQLASADSDGSQLSAALSFGRDFQRGAWNFGPYFRGTWTRVEFDAYTEELLAGQPGSGLGLAVEERDLTSATAVLGGKLTYTASRDWGILMPHVNLEWEHELKDDPQSIVMRFVHDPTQTPIAIAGDPLDTDYFNVGIGLSALFPGGKSGFVYYEHLVGASGISQGNLAIGVRIEF